jgi:hypothetical protein
LAGSVSAAICFVRLSMRPGIGSVKFLNVTPWRASGPTSILWVNSLPITCTDAGSAELP